MASVWRQGSILGEATPYVDYWYRLGTPTHYKINGELTREIWFDGEFCVR